MREKTPKPSRRTVLGRIAGASVGIAGLEAAGHAGQTGTRASGSGGPAIYRISDASARERTLADKLAESVSVLDFDVDPTGRRDSTAGFLAALRQGSAQQVSVPEGRYRVARLDVLGAAGKRIIGASRYCSVILAGEGSGPVLSSEVSLRGTTAYHLISDLTIDLQGADRVAIDLSSVNMTSVHRVHIVGRGKRGVGIRFGAPLQKGAYDNAVYDCNFENLRKAVEWTDGANNNAIYNCRALSCDIAFDAAPQGRVDTPRIFGGRAENCRIGLLEGAEQGAYYGVRFEGSSDADIRFTRASLQALVSGGLTASSRKAIDGIELARSPTVDAGDLGYWAIEESDSRPRVVTGRNVFGAAGKAPTIPLERDFAAYFANRVLIADHLSPVNSGRSNLGGRGSEFGSLHLSEGVSVGGRQVLGQRQRAISADRTGSANSDTLNAVLDVLRAHGLIED